MKTVITQQENAIQGTKRLIIDSARQFFSEYSYLGVSMDDIAKKLNITKAALYYHFAGKAEIYEKVLNNVFNDLSLFITQALNETSVDKKLYKLIKNYLDFGFEEKNLIKALILKLPVTDYQTTNHIIQLREQTIDLIQPIINEALASKKFIQRVDSRTLTSLLTSMMDGLLLEYSFLNKKVDSEKFSNQIIAALF
ncbi:MAG: TetR/AcrR family transcriptional regulator [Patescibacteria group bacterium]